MALLTATIPLSGIGAIQIYRNTGKYSCATIKSLTGADYILNGTLYNMTTGAVNCHLKSLGTVIAKPDYTVWGYRWDDGDDIKMGILPDATAKNYIACTPLIVNGAKTKLVYDSGQGGARQRSAIGIKNGYLYLYCNSGSLTPERLQANLFNADWESAVMLDGGGSTQCDFKGSTIKSSRRVNHYICVWLRDKEPKGDEPDVTKVNVYSKAKEGDTKLTANFKVSEFACSDGTDTILIHEDLPALLQKVRDHFGKAVYINSGYRTEAKNKALNGATYSQHKYGTAADISIKGIKPSAVAAYAETLMPNTGGIGIYSSFTHLDVRPVKARWNG